MGFMAGKRALIVGVASDRSIATGIAEAFAREGAEVAFTYQNEKLKSRVEKLATRLGQDTNLLFPCDVTSDEEIDAIGGEAEARAWLSDEKKIDPGLRVRDMKPTRKVDQWFEFLDALDRKTMFSERLTLDGLVSVWHPALR